MKDREEALRLLEMAGKDLIALGNMGDPGAFPDEVFGFHAQQAAEKTLKAWIALLGREYPMTHDLGFLLRFLEEAGADVERFWGLVEYTSFAVQFRYEAYDGPDAPLPRAEAVDALRALTTHVKGLAEARTSSL